jgi:hypothetical protein
MNSVHDWFLSTGLGYWLNGLWNCYRHDQHADCLMGDVILCHFCQRTRPSKCQTNPGVMASEGEESTCR